ncbi:DUF2125 domain-containing protein [Rhodovulum euryhalinum]|uniref:Uncharacterized protein DUF2125 n=1 Tax=Rhodovulum euryhalinum TaxID=35805 RepID=A0A4R2KI45_9RHOB|nr:DUF2125 domain-containing protein [Rhodovulum euryhalinum]TCO73293.1 uncharacterized protein DUF2125 [Rhodovulum euryhalinum]
MLLRISASAGAILAALAVAAPARADLTAEEVWSSWQAAAAGYGQTVTGTARREGDTLTVSGLVATAQTPDNSATVSQSGEIAFRERGDGSVEIVMPASFGITLDMRPAGGKPLLAEMSVAQDGLSMVASGSPEAITYDLSADDVTMTLDRAEVDGKPVDAEAVTGITGMTGRYSLTGGETTRLTGEIAAAGARFDVAVNVPEDSVSIRYAGEVTDLAGRSEAVTPPGMDTTRLGQMLAAGFASEGRVTHQGFAYAMTVADLSGSTDVAASFESGAIDIALGEDAMVYDVRSGPGQITMSGPALPLPQIDLAFADSAFRLNLPMVETEDPADFELLTRTRGLTVSDGIWAMLDPAGQLPRDPANLVIDLAGKARWLVDITNPDAMAAATANAPPAELHELNVKDLQLSLAGAELTGNGAFVFDNSDKITFDGVPKPTGGLALKLEGANTLLDRLVAMGLIPQDQATGMRMMLGMFARPTGEADTMTSQIEVTPDGQVLANGQRLR